MTDELEKAKSGEPADLWNLILVAYHEWDDPQDLLRAVQRIDEFEISDEPNLLLHMAFVLSKGGYYESANDVLQDLIAQSYTPAMCTLARIHLSQEVIDYDIDYAYELLERAIALGSLRARDVKASFRWARAAGVRKTLLFFPAWYWSFRYKWAVNVMGRVDDTIR